MKKMTKTLWVFLLMLGCLLGTGHVLAATSTRPAGEGTEEVLYQISTADELRWFAGLVNGTLTDGTAKNTAACATLTGDIDLGGEAWTPIGNYDVNTAKYTGIFDGAGHTISNLKVDNSSADYQGFVGYLRSGGAIQNLTLDESCSVTGNEYVGGVCGYNYSGSSAIKGCYNTGSLSGNSYVGGVSGNNSSGTISNCYWLECCCKAARQYRFGARPSARTTIPY